MAVKNAAPLAWSVNTLESRVTVPAHHDATAGSNAVSAAHTFEGRVVQETGTH